MRGYGVVLFATTSAVMQGEKALLAAGLAIKLVPVPREFSSDCGIAIRFAWDCCEDVLRLLGGLGVKYEAIHQMKE